MPALIHHAREHVKAPRTGSSPRPLDVVPSVRYAAGVARHGSELLYRYLAAQNETQSAFARRLSVSRQWVWSLLYDFRWGPSLKMATQIERATHGAVPARSWTRKRPDAPQDLDKTA